MAHQLKQDVHDLFTPYKFSIIESITQCDEKYRDAVSWPVVVTVKAAEQVS